MQEALRFLVSDAEPVDRTEFIESARLQRDSRPATGRGLALTIRGLRKSFGPNEVLRGVDLHIPAGQFVAVVGRSGCGKSTLLHALIGLLRPRAGSVLFRGEDYWSLDDAGRGRMGRRFGVLFQQGALWSTLTAAENVALPLQLFTALTRSSTTSTVTTLGATRRTSAA